MGSKPLYTTYESVKVRLVNKVQFQADAKECAEGELPNDLFCQLVADAESDVEQALRGRYSIPFKSKTKGTFGSLPDHTQRAIRKMVDLKAVILILQTDFGRGTHINAEGYVDPNWLEYKASVKLALGQDEMGKNVKRFKYSPPLEDLLLAPHNKEADDGFRGRIINTDADPNSAESYAADQVNNPASAILRRSY